MNTLGQAMVKAEGATYIETEYGAVRLSARTLAWLHRIHPKWREVSRDHRYRSKRSQVAREAVRTLEAAACALQALAFQAGTEIVEL